MNVDELIGQTKAVFAKAPLRVQKYREMYPELVLPLNLSRYIRWGTWLGAVGFFMICHYNAFSDVNDE